MKPQYADMLGRPIVPGDIIVYPTQSGSSSARNTFAYVEDLLPLVLHPMHAGQTWHATSHRSRIPYVREDQLHKSDPTEHLMPLDEQGRPREDKAYVIRTRPATHKVDDIVSVDRNGRRGALGNEKVMVVTDRVRTIERMAV